MDTTLFQSGKDGYLLSLYAMYGKSFQQPIPLNGLKSASVKSGSPSYMSLLCEDGTVLEADGRRYSSYLCAVLNESVKNVAECAAVFSQGQQAYEQENYAGALELFWEAAKRDYIPAQICCGKMYAAGKGTEEDKEKALDWFRKAAILDDATGQLYYAKMRYNGEGGEKKDMESALFDFCASGEHGNAEAQYRAGSMYRDGEGTKADDDKAFTWFNRAAEPGYAKAMSALGDLHERGLGFSVSEDRALDWYIKARDAGNESAQEKIDRIEKHKRKLLYTPKAQNAYKSGDYERALEWWWLLAKDGDIEAQFKCGEMYDKGLGTEKDSVKAFFWYEKAAEQGCSDAMLQCGIMCREGDGTEQSEERAQYWFDWNMQLLGQHLGGFFGKLEKDVEKG